MPETIDPVRPILPASSDVALPVLPTTPPPAGPLRVALVGNPNAGKTSLFNRLSGLRAQTANFPGTTVEHRRARITIGPTPIELIDLPGLYSLDATTPDEQVAREALIGEGRPAPDVMVLVIDATRLERNLFLASQVIEAARRIERPVVVALNQTDIARQHGLAIDARKLADDLGCTVTPISARTGDGLAELTTTIAQALDTPAISEVETACACTRCSGCPVASRYDWAETISQRSIRSPGSKLGRRTAQIDRVVAHRWFGLVIFTAVMFATFWLVYSLAAYPMDQIEAGVAAVATGLGAWLPAGDLRSLLTDGVIGGVGAMLVFLPQICILFFTLALLEDTGYLARATLVMDRLMQRVGLPGKAFVPMLSAHACAIPAIMSTRVIDDRRDRLATILVLPLLSCSARVPVYAMVIALMFGNEPLLAAVVFTGAYFLGIIAALVMAWVFRKTILPGRSQPLVIELPDYRRPSLRNALLLTYDRSSVFVKNAGTTILMLTIVLWALATYPKTTLEELPSDQQAAVVALEQSGEEAAAEALLDQYALEYSFAGRMGKAIQPVFEPLGFDWKMSVGVVTSFAAREVIVSTLAVLYGLGEEGEVEQLTERLAASTHPDGTIVFTTAAAMSLLVFYVLAMQCLPTQVVTKRETGSWKWAALQFGYMTVLAYVAALVTYQTAAAFGWAGA